MSSPGRPDFLPLLGGSNQNRDRNDGGGGYCIGRLCSVPRHTMRTVMGPA